jgi:hypothetical protein
MTAAQSIYDTVVRCYAVDCEYTKPKSKENFHLRLKRLLAELRILQQEYQEFIK